MKHLSEDAITLEGAVVAGRDPPLIGVAVFEGFTLLSSIVGGDKAWSTTESMAAVGSVKGKVISNDVSMRREIILFKPCIDILLSEYLGKDHGRYLSNFYTIY